MKKLVFVISTILLAGAACLAGCRSNSGELKTTAKPEVEQIKLFEQDGNPAEQDNPPDGDQKNNDCPDCENKRMPKRRKHNNKIPAEFSPLDKTRCPEIRVKGFVIVFETPCEECPDNSVPEETPEN